jgi:hypothetical protein
MLNKVIEYKLLQADSAQGITDAVNQAMKEEWVPSGAPVVEDDSFFQAMVRFESPAS